MNLPSTRTLRPAGGTFACTRALARRGTSTLAVALAAAGLTGAAVPAGAQSDGGLVYRVPVTGTIELGLAPFIERSLAEAEEAGALAVILDVDTPGGRVDAAERIADALRDATVPTYAVVNRRAFSAGALISLATREIYMLPGSVIGAVTPVDGTGTKASEKVVSAMRSEMRALAEARGLDPRVAEAMVDEDIEIEGVVAAGKLLTLTTEEAVGLGYARATDDFDGVLRAIGAPGATVQTMTVNWTEQIVRFVSNPMVAPLLLSLGFLGILVEIKAPGFGLAGALGLVSLSLFFGSHLILGLAGLEEVILLGAGAALVAVEVLLLPGFGIAGIAGIVAILGGVTLSLLGSYPTAADLSQALGVVATTLLVVIVTVWALLRHMPSNSRLARRGIFLLASTTRETGYASQATRPELVGALGTALTDLRPTGVGLFGEERLDVVSDAGWVEEGTAIRVVSAEGYRHVVRPHPGS